MQILIDSKATKCRNNVDFGSKKLDFWNSQEYRFFELEIHHYSFLLEFVEFLDEMKTPEIKKKHEIWPRQCTPLREQAEPIQRCADVDAVAAK